MTEEPSGPAAHILPTSAIVPVIGTSREERIKARADLHQQTVLEAHEQNKIRDPEFATRIEVRGQPAFYWSPVIDQMKRDGRLGEEPHPADLRS